MRWGRGGLTCIRKAEKPYCSPPGILQLGSCSGLLPDKVPADISKVAHKEDLMGISWRATACMSAGRDPIGGPQYTVVDGFDLNGDREGGQQLYPCSGNIIFFFWGMLLLPMLFGVEKVFFAEPISDICCMPCLVPAPSSSMAGTGITYGL